jgi:hypothetical protein
MLGHRFHCLVLVGAKSNALPIRKHEPLMMTNFRDDVFGHSGLRRVNTPYDGGLAVLLTTIHHGPVTFWWVTRIE